MYNVIVHYIYYYITVISSTQYYIGFVQKNEENFGYSF